MTELEFRQIIGIGPKDLLDSSIGLVDILAVEGDKVHLGFIASGIITVRSAEKLIKKFQNER